MARIGFPGWFPLLAGAFVANAAAAQRTYRLERPVVGPQGFGRTWRGSAPRWLEDGGDISHDAGLSIMRGSSAGVDLRSANLSMGIARRRTSGTEAGWSAARRSSFSLKSGGIGVDVLAVGPLRLRSALVMSRWRPVPAAFMAGRPRSTIGRSLEVGVSVEDGGPALSLSALRITADRRKPVERLAELAGGAPLAGAGFRAEVASGSQAGVPGDARLTLALSALRRPATELPFDGAATSFLDRRIEIGYRLSF